MRKEKPHIPLRKDQRNADKKAFSILQDVKGAAYVELVRFCARHSKAVTFVLTMQGSANRHCKNFLREIESLGGIVSRVQQWPGTIRFGKSFANTYTASLTPEIVELIEISCEALFSWSLPNLPEDICFYRKDMSVLFYSTTHDEVAYINMTAQEYREWENNKLLSFISLNLTPISNQ